MKRVQGTVEALFDMDPNLRLMGLVMTITGSVKGLSAHPNYLSVVY